MNQAGDENKVIKSCLNLSCVVFVLLVLWFAFTLGIERGQYAILFLGISFVISVLRGLATGRFMGLRGRGLRVWGILSIGIFAAATAYLYLEYLPLISDRAGAYDGVDVVIGAAVILLLFLIIWQEGGLSLLGLTALFLFYFHLGNLFPGFFQHSGFSVRRIVEESVLGFEGVYGIVLLTVSTWVAPFIIFAGIIQPFGALDSIVKGCTILFSRKKTLIPQIPVIASLIFGSFSRSATANVAGTGSFTIRIMKNFGLPPAMAGAIEAVASSGGQIMPPIMGATAFLMASFLGVSYLHIVVIGFLPALLYYVSFGFSVYLRTKRFVTIDSALSVDHATWSKEDWIKLFPLVLSIGILFTRLALLTPIMSACIEAIFIFVIAQFLRELFSNLRKKSLLKIFADFGRGLLKGIVACAPGAASIGLIGALMGLIVRVLTVTGLGPKLSSELVDISQGILPLLVFLTFVLCIMFGMAVSTVAVYVLTTFVAAPALKQMGIPEMASHFMIFYLGAMSMITPPVAPAALVASGIAGASLMATGWLATWLSFPIFVLGAAFVYRPELVLWSSQTPITAIILLIGLIGAAFAFHAPRKPGWGPVLEKMALIICSFGAIFFAQAAVYVPAAALIVAVLTLIYARQRVPKN